jgi:hypothetical protein
MIFRGPMSVSPVPSCPEENTICVFNSLDELLDWLERKVRWYLNPLSIPKNYVRLYCPGCLWDIQIHKSTYYRWRARGEDICRYGCHMQLKLVDSEFFEKKKIECIKWLERCRKILEKTFNTLTSLGRGSILVKPHPCKELTVELTLESYMRIERNVIAIYLSWLNEERLPKLLTLIKTLKDLNEKFYVSIPSDYRCEVDHNKMIQLGFKIRNSLYRFE